MKLTTRLFAVLILLSSIASAAPDWTARGKAWWAHIQYLADDKLEGRGTGTEGFAKAAAYLTDQFQKAGLQPAGTQGYVQPVEFNVLQLDETQSSLEFIRDGKSEKVEFGEEGFLIPTSNSAAVEAPAVFIGYGLKIPEANYDDFAGIDLQGKIAVFVTGGIGGVHRGATTSFDISADLQELVSDLVTAGLVALAGQTLSSSQGTGVLGRVLQGLRKL